MPQVSATYALGGRPVAESAAGVATCYTDLTLALPAGASITGVDISYEINAWGSGYRSEQQSRVVSPTLSRGETAWTAGFGDWDGVMEYGRYGVSVFNGTAAGNIVFRLEAYRTWSSDGEAPCSSLNHVITNNTYSITVYYETSAEAAEAQIRAHALISQISLLAESEIAAGRLSLDHLFGEARLLSAQSNARIHLDGLFQPLSFRGRAFPPNAEAAASGVTLYRCMLTGAPDGRTDAVLPIRSFQVRHRRDTASYYQVVIPSLAYIDAIDDRPNGQIVIWSDTDGATEELMRGALGSVRGDRGPNNQAITISGNASRAQTPRATYRVSRVLYQYSTFDGEQRLRIEPRAAIRPGDTIQFEGSFFEAGVVTWSVAVSETGLSAQMEVATLAEGA